ncbi:MAG TPA: DUF2589 domain-containing protein [Polyangiaceae bacterium]|nr:DUF2589 domain-containing protein [Polyangiaceae bacterium]
MAGLQALQNIPFASLIGGPLTAAVQAQAQAAMTTVEFIQNVGFEPEASPNGAQKVKEVTFKYDKQNENGEVKQFALTVPILAVVPIPYLRIESLDIDFSAKLNDMVQTDQTSSFSGSANLDVSWRVVKFRASASYKNDKSTKSSSTQDYSMSVKVHATQSDVPGGMQKVLDILESLIREGQTN